jgi:hypothetical protein
MLWRLLLFIEPDLKTPASFGNLNKEAHKKLGSEYPGLVFPNIEYIRNAAAHGHWRYNSINDAITIQDMKKDPQTHSVQELHELLLKVSETSGPTLRMVARLFLEKEYMKDTNLLRGLCDTFENHVSGNTNAAEAIYARMVISLCQILAPLRSKIADINTQTESKKHKKVR